MRMRNKGRLSANPSGLFFLVPVVQPYNRAVIRSSLTIQPASPIMSVCTAAGLNGGLGWAHTLGVYHQPFALSYFT